MQQRVEVILWRSPPRSLMRFRMFGKQALYEYYILLYTVYPIFCIRYSVFYIIVPSWLRSGQLYPESDFMGFCSALTPKSTRSKRPYKWDARLSQHLPMTSETAIMGRDKWLGGELGDDGCVYGVPGASAEVQGALLQQHDCRKTLSTLCR